ncbi:MAG TPA: PEP-CTERM sorting domain-containing protein [Rhodocyclaceae bacterium]|nr:PEP-CTERM sorting domain-containing protein [Rhodocyclaceae bacterium]
MLKKLSIATAMFAAIAFSGGAQALPISGLVNTGTGFANNAQDTNYALSVLSGATVAGAYGYVADNIGWPDGSPWIASSPDSKWLTPTTDEAQSFDPSSNGVYRWRLTFDLTGYDSSATFFSGRWAADNRGQAFLNGNLIGSASGFDSWSGFSASTGFLAGINTLDFVVTNLAQSSGNPTGIRVEFIRSDAAVAIPEPGTLALAGLALAGIALRRRKTA